MEAKEIKIDDIFFKNNFDCSSFENDIYNQFAKTMARSVDIDLAKTPLVDILTGYIRYNEAEQELERYKNIVDELEIYLQRKYGEYIDMESDDAFVISLVLDTLRELKGE